MRFAGLSLPGYWPAQWSVALLEMSDVWLCSGRTRTGWRAKFSARWATSGPCSRRAASDAGATLTRRQRRGHTHTWTDGAACPHSRAARAGLDRRAGGQPNVPGGWVTPLRSRVESALHAHGRARDSRSVLRARTGGVCGASETGSGRPVVAGGRGARCAATAGRRLGLRPASNNAMRR